MDFSVDTRMYYKMITHKINLNLVGPETLTVGELNKLNKYDVGQKAKGEG